MKENRVYYFMITSDFSFQRNLSHTKWWGHGDYSPEDGYELVAKRRHFILKLCMSVPLWRIWNYWECVRVALSKSINLLPFYFVIWNLPQVSCSTLNSISFQQSKSQRTVLPSGTWQSDQWWDDKAEIKTDSWGTSLSVTQLQAQTSHSPLPLQQAASSQPKDTSRKGELIETIHETQPVPRH